MENNPSIDNNSNKLFYQNFNDNYSRQSKKTNSQETIEPNSINDKNKIKVENIDEKEDYNIKLFGLNKIDYFYKFSNEIKKEENIGIPQDIQIIKEKEDNEDFIDDSFDESFLNMGSSSDIENIFKSIKKIKKQKLFKDTYFRFPYSKEKIPTIYCIPEIRIKGDNIMFIYDNKNIYLNIEQIIELIIKKELFINKNKNKDILNQAYICQIHKNKYVGYCSCKNNICKQCIKEGCNNEVDIKKDIPDNLRELKRLLIIGIFKHNNKIVSYKNQIKNIIKDLNNENSSILFKDVLNIKLNIIFNKMKKQFISLIYLSIIKSIILETLDIQKNKLKEKYNYNIIKNLIYYKKYLKRRKRKKRNKDNDKIFSRINYLIPFYSDENINKFQQNIYIGVTLKGFVIILYFQFYEIKNKNSINNKVINNINDKIYIDKDFFYTNQLDFYNMYTIINSKNLEERSPFKIIRLEQCFEKYNCIKGKKFNIFLVSIPSGGNFKEGLAKIIGISDDYKEIEILQTIYDYKGLVNAIEINLNNKYYLLSCTKGFKLWYYNSDTKHIEFSEIIPEKKNYNEPENVEYKNFRTYKELIFIERRKLLIAQVNFPEQYIYFYNINDDNNSFRIFFLAHIKINKEDPYFSESPFNSCLINDKYLLIGTKIDKVENKKNNKNNKNKKKQIEKENNNEIKEKKIEKAGIYIINLDTIFNDLSKIDKAIQINYFDCCKEIYCLSHIRENMFICSFKLIRPKNFKDNFSINTYEITEKNGMIKINKKYFMYGIYKNINSSKLIDDSFILCSNNEYNQLLKIDKNGEIYYYFDIRINNKF